MDQIRRRKWNWLGHMLRRNDATVDTTRPQRKRATKEYLEKRSGERNVHGKQMKAAARDRAGWRQVVCGVCYTGSDKA